MSTCELLPNCAFFRTHVHGSDLLKVHWIRSYCRDLDHSEHCRRKRFLRQTGRIPPDDMPPSSAS